MYINEIYRGCDWPATEAKRQRDRRARALRQLGYSVRTNTINFADLARDTAYFVEATTGSWPSFSGKCATIKPTTAVPQDEPNA